MRLNEKSKKMKIKKNNEIIHLTESDLKKIVKRVITEEKEPVNEVIGLTAAILAYRQTAKGKSKRLTKKIIIQ